MLQWTVYHSVRSAEKNPNLSPNPVIALPSQTDFITQVRGKATPQTHSKSNIKSPSSQGFQAGWARLALKINENVWPHHYQLQRECSGKQSRAERTKGHQGNWGFPLMFGSSWSWLQCKLCLIKSTVINKTQNQIQTEIDEDVTWISHWVCITVPPGDIHKSGMQPAGTGAAERPSREPSAVSPSHCHFQVLVAPAQGWEKHRIFSRPLSFLPRAMNVNGQPGNWDHWKAPWDKHGCNWGCYIFSKAVHKAGEKNFSPVLQETHLGWAGRTKREAGATSTPLTFS